MWHPCCQFPICIIDTAPVSESVYKLLQSLRFAYVLQGDNDDSDGGISMGFISSWIVTVGHKSGLAICG